VFSQTSLEFAMEYDRIATYTPALLRIAAWYFWRYYIGWGGIIAVVLPLGIFLSGWTRGSRSWLVYGALFVVLFGLLAFVMGYVLLVQRSLGQLRKMHTPVVQFTFTDSGLRSRSDLGSAEIPWRTIEQVLAAPQAWLLMTTKVNYITLPAAILDDEVRQLILRKVRR
jgi:hypothetical protein